MDFTLRIPVEEVKPEGFKRSVYKYLFLCSCGYKNETIFSGSFECPKCDRKHLHYLNFKQKVKTIKSPLLVLDKGLKHFHVARNKIKISISYKDKTFKVREEKSESVKFDLRNKSIIKYNGDEEAVSSPDVINRFFTEFSFHDILDIISNDENKELYRFAYSYLSKKNWSEYSPNLYRGLNRLINNPIYELMYFSGFNKYNHLTSIDSNGIANSKETSPAKILGIPKMLIPFVKEMNINLNQWYLKPINNLYEAIGGNNMKTFIEVLKRESGRSGYNLTSLCDDFVILYTDYNMKNVERLMVYVCRDVKLQQGIESPSDAIHYLKDYIKMMVEMEFEYEKYPKSLKKDHDIATLNYKVRKSEIDNKKVLAKVEEESYKSLEFKAKDLSVITPRGADDIISEGSSLSHCVASYVKDVAKGICKILFLRNTDSLEDSRVTIEVREDKVVQARGERNRELDRVEKDFVRKWAEKKKLFVPQHIA